MSLVQHICKFFLSWMLCSELALSFAKFILWYHLISCPFEAFQSFARISHLMKKVRLEKLGPLYLL